MSTETDEAVKPNPDKLTMPLVFDLMGPLLLRLQQPGSYQATIYAPLCEDHHANLLTDEQDFSLCGAKPPTPPSPCDTQTASGYGGSYDYTLTGPAPSSCFSECDPHRPRELIRVKYPSPLDASVKYHLKMTIPLPDRIVSLRPEQVWIHCNYSDLWLTSGCRDEPTEKNDPTCMVKSQRARGLRLIYKTCVGEPKITGGTDALTRALAKLCAVTRGIAGVVTPSYSMTLRYAAIPAVAGETMQDTHADAYGCFENLRRLIPGLSTWRVDFSDGTPDKEIENLKGKNPHDCLSTNIVTQNDDDAA